MTTSAPISGIPPPPAGARQGAAFPRRREGGRRYVPRRKVCHFCAEKGVVLDYKSIDLLARYISERGRIEPRRKTGTCARHQRSLAVQVKRARQMGFLPFTTDVAREGPPAR